MFNTIINGAHYISSVRKEIERQDRKALQDSESEIAKEIRHLMDHLMAKMIQCGENKRDKDAYNKLLAAYKILMGEV